MKQKRPLGFYTTRFIEADTPEAAESLVVAMLQADSDLQVPDKYRTPEAKIYVEKIEEVSGDGKRTPNRGFTFFTMDA